MSLFKYFESQMDTKGLTFNPCSNLHIGVILFFCTVLSVEDKLKGILRKDTNAAHPDTKN